MYNRADFQICNILADCPDDFPVSIYDDSGKYTMEYYTGTAKEAKKNMVCGLLMTTTKWKVVLTFMLLSQNKIENRY